MQNNVTHIEIKGELSIYSVAALRSQLLDAQQRVFHLFEQFAGFDDEGLQCFVHVHGTLLSGLRADQQRIAEMTAELA